MLVGSPVALPCEAVTFTGISNDDGLLRTNTGCNWLLPSLTLYVD